MPCIAHKNTLRNKAVLPIRKGEPLLFFKNFKFAQKTEERKMKRVFAMVMAVVMATVMFAGCSAGGNNNASNNSGSGDTIKVGLLGPHSGEYAVYGLGVRNGAELYFKKVNEAGGINGKQIELVVYDNKGDDTEAVTAFTRMVDEGVTALVGDVLTGNTLAVVGEANAVNMPMITPSATAAAVTVKEDGTVYSNVFRTCFIDPFQGEKMAAFAAEVLGVKTAAVFAQTGNDYAQGFADAFKAKCAELGVEIVAEEGYAKGDVDYKSQFTNIAAKNPEVVFCPNYYEDDGLIVTQARQVGVTGTFLGGDGWSGVKNYASADVLEGSYYCSGYAPASTDAVKQFEEEFVAAYGKDTLNMFAATAYDAAMIMCAALEKAEETGYAPASEEYKQAVIDAIRTEGPNVKGITSEGGYTFDEYNNPIKDAVIIKVTGGEEVFDRMF